jgi:hypothetical protein
MNDKVKANDTPLLPPQGSQENGGAPNLLDILATRNNPETRTRGSGDVAQTKPTDGRIDRLQPNEQSPKQILSDWVKCHQEEITKIGDSMMLSPSQRIAEIGKLLEADGIPDKVARAAKNSAFRNQSNPVKYSGPSIDRLRRDQVDEIRATRVREARQKQIEDHPTAFDIMAGDIHRLNVALDPAGAGGVGAGVYGIARLHGESDADAKQVAAKVELGFQVLGMARELTSGGHRAVGGAQAEFDRVRHDPVKFEAPLGEWKPEPPRLDYRGVEPLGQSWGEKFESLGRDRVAPGARMAVPKTESVDFFLGGRRDHALVVSEQKDGLPIHVQIETWMGCDLYQQQAQGTLSPNVAEAVRGKVNAFAERWQDQKWQGGSPEFKGPRSQPIDDGHGPVAVRQKFIDPAKFVVVVYLAEAMVTPALEKQAQDALNKAVADAVSRNDPHGKSLPPIEAVVIGQNGSKTPILHPDRSLLFQPR